ncbi:MAG TPA: preprotein translocase subunit YajC [Pirellulaceae bacterium]|nr:preprotein translocase subunit YajC [Pirellulaceae bacterium]
MITPYVSAGRLRQVVAVPLGFACRATHEVRRGSWWGPLMENCLTLLDLALLAQDGKGAAAPASGFDPTFLFPMVLIGVLFYFMLIRPERKKSSEQADMLKALKKNDHVVTIGGIFGTVVNVQDGSDVVTLRVDENTNAKLRVRRSAISAIVKDESPPNKEETP